MSTPYSGGCWAGLSIFGCGTYGDHDPTQTVTLATIRARIDQWQAKQEQR